MKIRVAGALALAIVCLTGCGPERIEKIAWSEAAASRRVEFVESMVKAMRDFDDLYGSRIKIDIVDAASGNPTVTVNGLSDKATADLERPVSVAITNFAMKYPGIGFMFDKDGKWRILIPADMLIPVSGDFNLNFS